MSLKLVGVSSIAKPSGHDFFRGVAMHRHVCNQATNIRFTIGGNFSRACSSLSLFNYAAERRYKPSLPGEQQKKKTYCASVGNRQESLMLAILVLFEAGDERTDSSVWHHEFGYDTYHPHVIISFFLLCLDWQAASDHDCPSLEHPLIGNNRQNKGAHREASQSAH